MTNAITRAELQQVAPATWRSASLAPWTCLLAMYQNDVLPPAAVQRLSDDLAASTDPALQQLQTHNPRSAQEHLDLARSDRVVAFAAGQALLTIVGSGPAGQTAAAELLALLRANSAEYRVHQRQVSSIADLLDAPVHTGTYVEPVDTRARRYQIVMLVAFIALFLGMGFLLRM